MEDAGEPEARAAAEPDPTGEPDPTAEPPRRHRTESIGQSIGGVLFGFEQQVLRTMPPAQELVRPARPDSPIPAGDGSLIHIGMPDLVLPDDAGQAEPGPGSESVEDRRADP